jgi:quinol monooxygenase YgiN
MFTVEPARQQKLVAMLATAIEKVMQHQPGSLPANLHASTDGEHVVNYAQWESEQAIHTMLANPQARSKRRYAHT